MSVPHSALSMPFLDPLSQHMQHKRPIPDLVSSHPRTDKEQCKRLYVHWIRLEVALGLKRPELCTKQADLWRMEVLASDSGHHLHCGVGDTYTCSLSRCFDGLQDITWAPNASAVADTRSKSDRHLACVEIKLQSAILHFPSRYMNN